jgi:hypothetical protein
MSDIKFYNPDPANYVSNYVPMPVDTILDSLQNEQGIYDKTFENQKEYDKIVADVLPGYLTQDVYGQQFKQEYGPEFLQDLTEKVISGQDNIRNLKKEIRKRQTQIANDPMIKALKIDRAYSDMVDKHRLEKPNSEVYPMTQLTMDQIKAGVVPTAENYRIAADYNVYGTMSSEIQSLKPDIDNIKKGGAMIGPDGSMQTITDIAKVTELKKERITKWFDDSFEKYQQNGQMDNIYIKAAKDAGNPNLWNDPQFRKNVFSKVAEPLLVNLYKQVDIHREVNNPGTTKPVKPKDNDGKEKTTIDHVNTTSLNVRVGNATDANGNPITSVSVLEKQPKEWEKLQNKNKKIINEILNDASGGQVSFTPAMAEMLEFKDGALKVKDSYIGTNTDLTKVNPILNAANKNADFRTAMENYYHGKNSQEYYEGFIENLKTQAGVKDYKPEVIEEAENKGKEYIKNHFPSGGLGRLATLYKKPVEEILNSIISGKDEYLEFVDKEDLDNIILKSKEITENNLKGKPEGKIHDLFKKYNERMEDSQVRFLPDAVKEVKQLKSVIEDAMINSPNKFKDFISNNKLNDKQLKKILEEIPKNKDGEINWDEVKVGTARDSGDGLVGVLSFKGNFIEFNVSEFGLDKLAEDNDPEFALSKAYNQIAQTVKTSLGQAGQVNLGSQKINFKTQLNNQGKVQYEFLGPDGTPRVTNSASEMLNVFKQAKDKSNLEFELRKKDIISRYQGRVLSDQELKAYQTELSNLEKEKLSQTMSEAGLGKQQPQSQGNRLGL